VRVQVSGTTYSSESLKTDWEQFFSPCFHPPYKEAAALLRIQSHPLYLHFEVYVWTWLVGNRTGQIVHPSRYVVAFEHHQAPAGPEDSHRFAQHYFWLWHAAASYSLSVLCGNIKEDFLLTLSCKTAHFFIFTHHD